MTDNLNHPIRGALRNAFDRGIFIVDPIALFGSGLTSWYIPRYNHDGPALALNATMLVLIYLAGILLFIGVLIGLHRAPFYSISQYQLLLRTRTYSYGTAAILASCYFIRVLYVPRSYTLLFMTLASLHVWVGHRTMLMNRRSLARWDMGNLYVLVVANGNDSAVEREVGNEWLSELGYELGGLIATGSVSRNVPSVIPPSIRSRWILP